jgi:4-hydroxy-tetrahydrodipicolinate synthase
LNLRQGRLPAARQLQSCLGRLEACLSDDVPAALKYALSLLGLMQPYTRLPIVELNEADKARVACALAAVTADDPIEAAEA